MKTHEELIGEIRKGNNKGNTGIVYHIYKEKETLEIGRMDSAQGVKGMIHLTDHDNAYRMPDHLYKQYCAKEEKIKSIVKAGLTTPGDMTPYPM